MVRAVPVLALTMQNINVYIAFLLCALLAACASTPPFDTSGVDATLTPDRAVTNADASRGRRVAWGGVVINTRNLEDTTEIEVLGYPLESSGRPDTGAKPQHRFLIMRSGYLESADYRGGRLVSAVGVVTGIRHGLVGEAPYVYPVMRAEKLYLWPIDTGRRGSNVHFGIGIGVIVH